MKKETFVQGVTILEETFSRTLNRMIAWEILRELKDEEFIGAVRMMVQGLRTLYPNDNVVAIVQEYITEYKKKKYQEKIGASQKEEKRLDWEPVPPPPEWNEMMEKLRSKSAV